jgi:hypothetical protein
MFARRACIRIHRSERKPLHIAETFFMNPMGYVNHNSLNQGVGFFRADVYVDITDVIEKKIQALACIESQYYTAYAPKRAEMADGSSGDIVNLPYAEPFQRYRPAVCYKLPVSDFNLHCAEETNEEKMVRRGYMISKVAPMPEGSKPSCPPYKFRRDLYDR